MRGEVAIGGRYSIEVGSREYGEDLGYIRFDVGVGRGDPRRFRLTGFTEMCKAGIDGIGTLWRIGVLNSKVCAAEAVSKGRNISNQPVSP